MRMILITFVLVFGFNSYSAGGPPARVPADKAKPDPESLMQEILKLNENISCQKSEDCTSVAMGARHCGGPAGYLVVSLRNSNYAKIAEKAKIHETISKEYLMLKGGNQMGTCQMIMPTATVCDRSKCVEAPL